MPGPSSWPCRGSPGLEPQRVPRTQPGRDARPGPARPPRSRSRPRRDGALDSVLTRVAGARSQAGGAGPLEAHDAETSDVGRGGRHLGQSVPRLGALHGQDGTLVGHVHASERGEYPRRVRGVGHDVETLIVDPPHDDVVDDGPVLGQEVGVLGSPRVDLAQVVAEGSLQMLERVVALDAGPCPGGSRRRPQHRRGRRGVRPRSRSRRPGASPSHRRAPSWPPTRRGRSTGARHAARRCRSPVRSRPPGSD